MGWVVKAKPQLLYPRERPGTHCIGGWVAPGPVWKGAEYLALLPPPGLDPRTVQPVASRYTDCVIPALAPNLYSFHSIAAVFSDPKT